MDYIDNFQFLRPYIDPDEQVLWKGQPEKGSAFTNRSIVLIPFSIIWLTFCFFWEAAAIRSGVSILFMLWGLPFIGVGLYMLFGEFIRKSALRKKTFYVITNKKIIIKSGSNIEIHNGDDLPPMNIKLHKNGNGTIIFCEDLYMRKGSVRTAYFALENISDIISAQRAVGMMDK